MLSQVARYQPPESERKDVYFFPSAEVVRHLPNGRTFDEQLVRDLSLKSLEQYQNDENFLSDIASFVKRMNLAHQCIKCAAEVEQEVEAVRRANAAHRRYPCLVKRLEADDPARNALQQRIQGPILEIGVDWPAFSLATSCAPRELKKLSSSLRAVSIPVSSWEKLTLAYEAFGAPQEEQNNMQGFRAAEALQHRAATLALRYEHCLASGSLQLCADSHLKREFHKAGYNVVDLCASPINAYMGSEEDITQGSDPQALGSIVPRRFCSAFFDTDVWFGSVGSALLFDPQRFLEQVRRDDRTNGKVVSTKLLLTLDVPYDEDLCELLFNKLAKDCREAVPTDTFTADYLLVMPLWWDLRFPNVKKEFFKNRVRSSTDVGAAAADDVKALEQEMWALIRHHAGYLEHGHPVAYRWPTELPEAVTHSEQAEAVFDAVFVDTSYQYFCTVTNRPLTGVTATEVVGISQTQESAAALKQFLRSFYNVE